MKSWKMFGLLLVIVGLLALGACKEEKKATPKTTSPAVKAPAVSPAEKPAEGVKPATPAPTTKPEAGKTGT